MKLKIFTKTTTFGWETIFNPLKTVIGIHSVTDRWRSYFWEWIKNSGLIFDWYCMVNLCVLFPKSSHKVTFIYICWHTVGLVTVESGEQSPGMPTLDAGHFPCARFPGKMLIYSNTNKLICLSYDLSNLLNNKLFFMGNHLYCCCCELHPYKEEKSIYPRIILQRLSQYTKLKLKL